MRTLTLLLALALFACKQSPADPPKAPPPAKPKAAAAPVQAEVTSDTECVGPWAPDGPESKTTAGHFSVVRTGSKLVATSKAPDDTVVLGVIADIKENTPENIANLKAIIAHFRRSEVEAVVIVGDLGDTQNQIEDVLELMGRTELPTFSIIGNREPKAAYNAAFAAAASRHPNLFDLNQIRLAIIDRVALVSVPGYYNPAYIHAGEAGCHYRAAAVAAAAEAAQAAGDATVVLVSHGPPKQTGPEALDRTLEDANVGDDALSTLIQMRKIRFGLFANIHESGGRATNLDGTKLVKAGTPIDTFYLNPGPADAVRWSMNDGSESAGMAAVVTFADGKAKYDMHRLAGR